MWISRFFNNQKKYKRFLYLEKEYYTYRRVKWEDIRIEYKELLDTINWNQTLWSDAVLHSAFRKYRTTEEIYQHRKRNSEILEELKGRRLNGNSKFKK